MTEFEYWSVKYDAAVIDHQTATVRHALSFNPKIEKDGDRWCILFGENLQKGISGFGESLQGALDDFSRNVQIRTKRKADGQ